MKNKVTLDWVNAIEETIKSYVNLTHDCFSCALCSLARKNVPKSLDEDKYMCNYCMYHLIPLLKKNGSSHCANTNVILPSSIYHYILVYIRDKDIILPENLEELDYDTRKKLYEDIPILKKEFEKRIEFLNRIKEEILNKNPMTLEEVQNIVLNINNQYG